MIIEIIAYTIYMIIMWEFFKKVINELLTNKWGSNG